MSEDEASSNHIALDEVEEDDDSSEDEENSSDESSYSEHASSLEEDTDEVLSADKPDPAPEVHFPELPSPIKPTAGPIDLVSAIDAGKSLGLQPTLVSSSGQPVEFQELSSEPRGDSAPTTKNKVNSTSTDPVSSKKDSTSLKRLEALSKKQLPKSSSMITHPPSSQQDLASSTQQTVTGAKVSVAAPALLASGSPSGSQMLPHSTQTPSASNTGASPRLPPPLTSRPPLLTKSTTGGSTSALGSDAAPAFTPPSLLFSDRPMASSSTSSISSYGPGASSVKPQLSGLTAWPALPTTSASTGPRSRQLVTLAAQWVMEHVTAGIAARTKVPMLSFDGTPIPTRPLSAHIPSYPHAGYSATAGGKPPSKVAGRATALFWYLVGWALVVVGLGIRVAARVLFECKAGAKALWRLTIRMRVSGASKKDDEGKGRGGSSYAWAALPRAVKLPSRAVEEFIQARRQQAGGGGGSAAAASASTTYQDQGNHAPGGSGGIFSMGPSSAASKFSIGVFASGLVGRLSRRQQDLIRQVIVVLAGLLACLLTVDTVLRVTGMGGLSFSLPDSRWRNIEKAADAASIGGENAEGSVPERFLGSQEHMAGFHRLEEWIYPIKLDGADPLEIQALMQTQVERALEVKDVVVAKLRKAGAGEVNTVYLGNGGPGGKSRVVVWVRLMERRGTSAASRRREQAALFTLAKIRNAYTLPIELEAGWSLEGSPEEDAHPSVECDLTCLDWRTSLEDCCNPWGQMGGVGSGGLRAGVVHERQQQQQEEAEAAAVPGKAPEKTIGDIEREKIERALESGEMTTEQEAEVREKEREDWLIREQQRLFQRQQKMQTDKIKHMSFLQGVSKNKKVDEKDLKRDKDKGKKSDKKVDPLLKRVMSKVYTDKVMDETVSAYTQLKPAGHASRD